MLFRLIKNNKRGHLRVETASLKFNNQINRLSFIGDQLTFWYRYELLLPEERHLSKVHSNRSLFL